MVPPHARAESPGAAHAQGRAQRGRRRAGRHPAARGRRDAPLLHERRGTGRPGRLRAKKKAELREVSEATLMALAATAVRPSAARVWWSAVRPVTFAASVAPVLAGTAIGVHDGGTRWAAGIGALVVALGIQLGVNFANDYSDFVRGADANRVGPLRAASSGIVDPRHVRWAAIAAFGVAGLAGLAVSVAVDVRLLVVGAACLLAGWLYTGGPRPYGYLGPGGVVGCGSCGPLATVGSVYVETGHVTALSVLMGCAMGFLATAILVLNNLRDLDSDAAVGKRTLATRISRGPTRILLLLLVGAAFAVPVVLAIAHLASASVLLVELGIPVAVGALRTAFVTAQPAPLVGALKRMATAQAVYAVLFAMAFVL